MEDDNFKIIQLVQNIHYDKYGLIMFSNRIKEFTLEKVDGKIINIEKTWMILNDYSLFTITNLHKILENVFYINVDLNIFTNIDNIYQLSKLITTINVGKTNSLKIKKKSNVLKIQRNFYNTITTCKTNLISDYNFKNKSCSICMKNADKKDCFVNTVCNHFYCIQCFESLVNFTNKNNETLKCGYCRKVLKNNTISLVNYETTFTKYKNLVSKFKDFRCGKINIFREYNYDNNLLFFVRELITKINPNYNQIEVNQIYSLDNIISNEEILIIDSNNTNKKIISNILKLGITNIFIIELN